VTGTLLEPGPGMPPLHLSTFLQNHADHADMHAWLPAELFSTPLSHPKRSAVAHSADMTATTEATLSLPSSASSLHQTFNSTIRLQHATDIPSTAQTWSDTLDRRAATAIAAHIVPSHRLHVPLVTWRRSERLLITLHLARILVLHTLSRNSKFTAAAPPDSTALAFARVTHWLSDPERFADQLAGGQLRHHPLDGAADGPDPQAVSAAFPSGLLVHAQPQQDSPVRNASTLSSIAATADGPSLIRRTNDAHTQTNPLAPVEPAQAAVVSAALDRPRVPQQVQVQVQNIGLGVVWDKQSRQKQLEKIMQLGLFKTYCSISLSLSLSLALALALSFSLHVLWRSVHSVCMYACMYVFSFVFRRWFWLDSLSACAYPLSWTSLYWF
jgi:hypothetical protein